MPVSYHSRLVLASLGLSIASLDAQISYSGVSGGEWATDSNWNGGSYPSSSEYAVLDTTVNLSVPVPNNIRAIRIGTGGSGTLNIASQATLYVASHASWDSHIGNSSGNQGTVNQEGGTVEINELEIGRNSSTGFYNLHGGTLTIVRQLGNNSLYLGTDDSKGSSGNGTMNITAGNLLTRKGVYLGSASGGLGTFHVEGSHAGSIGIGSHGVDDGSWTQNAGSTLSVRIDKTSQGVTPIFIDEVGNNGGGDVIFESGSLLDVDFTSTFINGGTFTVMEWEGSVTDNGLQLAPTVDTNIWSLDVDEINKRLTVTAVGSPLTRAFVHPGLSHKLSDLERMRDMVAAGIEPWATTYAELSSHPRAQHTYSSTSSPSYTVLGDSGGNNSNAFLINDGYAAYYNALMWMLTGDSRHADASIRVFNNWTGLVRNETSIPLDSGRHWRLIEAAEIIKSTYSGWDPVELQAFKDMLVYPGYSNTTAPTTDINNRDVTFYWQCYQGDPARHGNQGLFCMRMVLAMGVFLDNEIMYDRALRYLQGAPARADDLSYPSGVPITTGPQASSNVYYDEYSRSGDNGTVTDYGYNEVMHNLIWPNGQGQESSRDQAHCLTGPGITSTMAEIAWSQGDDLYGHLDNRLLLGFEHFYRYNISYENSYPDQTTPWEPTVANGEYIQRLDRSGRWFSLQINPYLAGNIGPEFIHRGTNILQPLYEMNLGHYRDRMGVQSADTKWLERGFDLLVAEHGVEPEGGIGDFPTRGSLAFRRVSPGDPVQSFTNGNPDFAMHTFPGTVEAENYDFFPVDGQGFTYHDLSSTNAGAGYRPAEGVDVSSASEGGFALSSIESGEWVTYTVSVPSAGNYDITIRYASTAPGGTIQFSFDGNDVTGNVPVPNGAPASAGSSDWQDLVIAAGVPLSQGVQQLTINFGGTSNAFLLNSFTLETPPVFPVAHWRFEEGSGNIANDCSGNGHHGTINNPSWTTRTGGGNALSFNGSSANVTIPSSAFSSLTNEVTLAFWAFGDTASLPADTVAFFGGTSSGGRILNVHLPWNNSRIYWDASDRIDKPASEAEFEGSWAHWAFTKDAVAGTMHVYRNGVLWHSGTERTNPISTVAQAYIGSQNTSRYYSGLLDDFRLYDVALSSAAISTLYANALNAHTVTYTAGAGGSISGITSQSVDNDSNSCAVTAVAAPNYSFVNWSDGSTANPRTDFYVTSDVSVTANFTIDTYTLTYTAGANGSISGTSPQTVDHGSDGSEVIAVPATNYHFVNWSDGSTASSRKDLNVTGGINVTANFEIDTHTLTYAAGAGGSISGISPQTVDHGSNGGAVTAVPAANYSFVNWSDGNTSQTRTDLNVTGNISVTANFTIDTYTLTYTAGANGSITGTSPQTVGHGGDGSEVVAVPATNYHFVNWSDGSTSISRKDLNVTGGISVTANFAIDTYMLTYTAGANGSITGASPQTVDHGSSGSEVTAIAGANASFVDWSDGSTANPRTDLNVTDNVTVTANFALDTYTLTYSAGDNGSITGISPQTIDHGTDGSEVAAVPDANYHFVDWSDGSTANSRKDLNVTGNINVAANFASNYTDLENWRFANFGSYDNSGTAADSFDADFDGTANLLEYATGTDPNTPGPSPLTIGPVSGGSDLELRFDRILDPSLNYLIEGTDNLEALSWDPVWSGTGTSAGPVPIPEAAWPSGHDYYFFRLGVSY
ncbi:InlB B-repeat-containing protein [Haloferula sp.]|uniref:InlB B-repeat-containing protein n=1 Tax=Haloferula sp. TaxID=2497595 RepID=UPI00329BEC72